MASLQKSVRGGRTYLYIQHTYRWNGRASQIRKYIGVKAPSNLGPVLAAVEREASSRTWFPLFERIRKGYRERLLGIPREMVAKEAHEFVVQFTFDTNRIEGSTLSFSETAALVDHGLSPASKPAADMIEARAHADLAERVLSHPPVIDLKELLRWHSSLFGVTKPGITGRLRTYEVGIGGTRYRPPSGIEVRPMTIELIRWVSRNRLHLHPVELAAEFHYRFEAIHPFGDVGTDTWAS